MLHVCYSNYLESLAAQLADDLAAGRRDPFTPIDIVVPNRSVASYLKLVIAGRNRIAANLRFPFLERFLAERIDPAAAEVIDRSKLEAILIGVLADPALVAEPELAPVARYLAGGGDTADAVELRRCQLAAELAGRFVDYALTRPDMIATWPDRPSLDDTMHAATEAWQRRLWRAVFGEAGLLHRLRPDRAVGTLPDLLTRTPLAELALPDHVYVVGFSYLAPLYHLILGRLATAAEVRVYALNPCREYWEDVRAGWETRADRSAGPGELADDSPALALWGRPGRDHTRLLNELSGCDFTACFIDPVEGVPTPTALARLQHDILVRAPAGEASASGRRDGSIRILACPGVQRELEIVGNEIWALCQADPSLRFNQIAVLITPQDQEIYQAHVGSVFRELDEIPHHIIDLPLSGASRIVEALEILLLLPFGEFTRPELLRFITHPAVLARFPDADGADWVRWCDALGVVHGADHTDHAETYIDRDIYNWDQGIRRLALGAFMAGQKSGEEQAVDLGRDSYLPVELAEDALPSAARFALLVRSLIEDIRYCRDRQMPLGDWAVFLDLLATSYLCPDDAEGAHGLARCRDALASLGEIDLTKTPVGYRTACELARARLGKLRGARGTYLADGVTVAPLTPMTAIPYRVIFVVGLGEGRFPGSDHDSPLDLRSAAPRAGDVGPRERDRFAFLETLLAARERLYLSYVARDEQTGEPLEPSAVVLELARLLAPAPPVDETAPPDDAGAPGLEPDPVAALTHHHPLRRFDPVYFPDLSGPDSPPPDDTDWRPAPAVATTAHAQARARALRRDLERHVADSAGRLPTLEELRAQVGPDSWAALRELLVLPEPAPPPAETAAEPVVSLPLTMVRRFLECPLQTWAAVVLRLREREIEDLIEREDEPFDTAAGPTTGLLREIFTAHLRAGGDRDALLARYRRRATLLELGGNAPTGLFSEIERQRHQDTLLGWLDQLESLRNGPVEPPRILHFGRAPGSDTGGELLPPIRLAVPRDDGAPLQVELYGRTEPIDRELGSLVLSASAFSAKKHLLRGFIDQLALTAAGVAEPAGHAVTIITAGSRSTRHPLAPIAPETALGYLATLVGDLLGGSHDYLLPYEAVIKQHERPDLTIADIVAPLRTGRGHGMSSRYGPVRRLAAIPAPDETTAAALIARRFELWFTALEGGDG